MNPFLNPIFLGKIVKSYLSDIDRIWRLSQDEMRKYQDKCLRQIVKYAYTIPVYHKKYKARGVHPNDIQGINDIEKLPIITKNDLTEHFPDGIIAQGFDKKNNFLISTSGSAGKPVTVYYDRFSAIKSLLGFVRELKVYGGDWRKSRCLLVIDLDTSTIEHTLYVKSILPLLKKFTTLKNIRYVNIDEAPEKIIEEINTFNPEFLSSDPAMLRKLAFLKNNGFGENIQPHLITSSSAMLDSYTRKYVEHAFDARVLDVYGATETGPIAFECLTNNHYHVHSDFVFLEFLDEDNSPVSPDMLGHVVVTKLYGQGTPILRYSGLDDLAVPSADANTCVIKTQIISRIEGRNVDLLVLPGGKMLTPLAITGIPWMIMNKFKTFKIKQFQIIQHTIDEIEVLIVIDNKLRNVGLPIEKFLDELQKGFSEKIGSGIHIVVHEVDEIQSDGKTDKSKVVISKVKQHQQ